MEARELTATETDSETDGDRRLRDSLWTPVGSATVDAAQLRMGAHVFDACCGSGATALRAAERTSPLGTVDAVDLSGPLISRARREAAARGLTNVRFARGDALEWPAPSGGYDSVLCAGGVGAFRDPAVATERLRQLLRPGGRLTVTVWAEAALEPLSEVLVRAAAEEDVPPESKPGPQASHSPVGSPALLRDWLTARSLSFADIRCHPLTLPADPELLWPLLLGTRLKRLLGGLTPAATARVRRRFGQALRAGKRETVDVTTLIGTGTLCRVTSAAHAGDARPWLGSARSGDAAGPPSPP